MSEPANMSGLWSGTYRYDGHIGAVPFTAAIAEDGGEIFGTTLEAATFGMGDTEELEAEISGTRRGLSVDFRKIYDASTGIIQPPLLYIGDANTAFTEVYGTWRFAGLLRGILGRPTGTFTMTRIARGREAATAITRSAFAT